MKNTVVTNFALILSSAGVLVGTILLYIGLSHINTTELTMQLFSPIIIAGYIVFFISLVPFLIVLLRINKHSKIT